MQQAGGADTGFAGDLGQRRTAPPVAGQQSLRDGQDPLFAVLALGAQRVIRPCLGHRTPSSNQPTEHTVGWLDDCDKGRILAPGYKPSDLAMITFITSLVPA